MIFIVKKFADYILVAFLFFKIKLGPFFKFMISKNQA